MTGHAICNQTRGHHANNRGWTARTQLSRRHREPMHEVVGQGAARRQACTAKHNNHIPSHTIVHRTIPWDALRDAVRAHRGTHTNTQTHPSAEHGCLSWCSLAAVNLCEAHNTPDNEPSSPPIATSAASTSLERDVVRLTQQQPRPSARRGHEGVRGPSISWPTPHPNAPSGSFPPPIHSLCSS